MKQIKVTTSNPEETQQLGRALGELFVGGEVVLLSGALGAGKTCLTQGIAWGLGVQEHARSPTFVLVSEYQGRLTLYHLDLYRLDDLMEIDDLGLDEYFFGEGVCVIEWAEKGHGVLPEENLTIRIEVTGENDRVLTLEANGTRYEPLLDQRSINSYPGPFNKFLVKESAEGRSPFAGGLGVSPKSNFSPLPGQEGGQGDGRKCY